MCAKFLLETIRKMGQRMVPPPALAFIFFNPAAFSEVLIKLLHCVPLNT